MENATHEAAANTLKSAGKVVDLLVKYNPEGGTQHQEIFYTFGNISNDVTIVSRSEFY